MPRITRLAAVAALAAGLVTALPGPAFAVAGDRPAPAPSGAAEPGPTSAGQGFFAIYPTKGECLAAGNAGLHVRWDEFECLPWADPFAAATAGADTQWILVTKVYF